MHETFAHYFSFVKILVHLVLNSIKIINVDKFIMMLIINLGFYVKLEK